MKQIFSFLVFITMAFAVKDYMIKPPSNLNGVLYSTVEYYPESLDSEIGEDDKNVFKYSGHFRVIYGKEYEGNVTIENLADEILDIADYVWQKEVEDDGFKEPINSDKYYIDIYIGNTSAYNKAENTYITISSSYAGYATSYADSTPYFVLNKDMSKPLLEVTVAHEFFHTIQYAYGLGVVSNSIWNKNLWFMEATATMMEDEVYDDVNDYIGYLPYYLPYINYSIDYTNGIMEYGKVLFAKYLKNRFGIEIIKKIFEDYIPTETLLEDIQKEVASYNETFDNFMLDYGKCLVNIHTCYKDGADFPDPDFYLLDTLENVGYYGIVLYKSGSDSYLYGSNSEYLQSDFYGNKNVLGSINANGLIFINRQNRNIVTDFLKYNEYNATVLKKGWNLIGNVFDKNIDFSDFDVNITWVYRNGKYCAYSNDEDMMNKIKILNYQCENNYLYPGEGAWVYVDKDKNITLNGFELFEGNLTDEGIHTTSSVLNPYDLSSETLWYYDEGEWEYYSDLKTFEDYSKIEYLIPGRGYIIIKDEQ